MADVVGAADSVVATVVRANRYGIGSFLFDALVVVAILAIVYFGVKKVKRWRSNSREHIPSQPSYLQPRY